MAYIPGTEFNDSLKGSYSTDDLIQGFGGNDTLDGAGGFDTLVGGIGADTFNVFAIDYNFSGIGYVTITEFFWNEGDKLNIYSSRTSITSSVIGGETEIYSDNNLIAVVRGNFNFASDAIIF